MTIGLKKVAFIFILGMAVSLVSCNRGGSKELLSDPVSEAISELDTAHNLSDTAVVPADTIVPSDFSEPEYEGGIIPVIEQASKEYADRLSVEGQDGFLVVDKARMKIILYDKYGFPQRTFGMACAKKYGNKHKRADSRTPEGFFTVQGIYDSTDWLFTDDDGKTSKVKGQFGPRFIRLSIPTTSQIGIHGTRAPWSIGHRVSHGCIRITNEEIMELVELVHPGMPVIVIPGKRDRQVNREEGSETVYFATAPNYEMSPQEKKLQEKTATENAESHHHDDTIPDGKDSDKVNNKQEHSVVPEGSKNTENIPVDTVAEKYF